MAYIKKFVSLVCEIGDHKSCGGKAPAPFNKCGCDCHIGKKKKNR